MSLIINHNLMAMNSARNLNTHYGALSVSVRRLSSGLRIGTAADDAAGLAIRELMRADITTLNQGVRNANDAVSMLQTADGALQIIDEKLIRMKELAEQAATGTYNSDQRLMIDSEYQAMAKEISRIANATDFNGIHMLNGNADSSLHDGSGLNSTGKIKVHFGTGNSSAEDYYYIRVGDCTAEGFSLGEGSSLVNSTEKLQSRLTNEFEAALSPLLDSGIIAQADYDAIMANRFATANSIRFWGRPENLYSFQISEANYFGGDIPGGPTVNPKEGYTLHPLPGDTVEERYAAYLALPEYEQEKYNYAFGRDMAYRQISLYGEADWWTYSYDSWDTVAFPNQEARDAVQTATLSALTWYTTTHTYAGNNIRTQENAQMALDAINNAIVEKDKTRGHLGATQNRLENTISNLQIQAENLQAAESRISDVDVAQEMTEFTRQQILTQGAVAMLAQANSLPQMALQLIQG